MDPPFATDQVVQKSMQKCWGTILVPRSTPTATTMTTLTSSTKHSRDPLCPKPILDRRLLVEALTERGIELKPSRIDQFYQLLHRQHYPSLGGFVETYERRERVRLGTGCGGTGDSALSSRTQCPPEEEYHLLHQQRDRPFPNPISARATKQNLHLLPRALLSFLADPSNGFSTLTSKVAESRLSSDETTTKLAIELRDGHVVESVIMRYNSPEGSRATLCVSSQVGCAMGCTFCATGTMGYSRNLSSGEILEQIVHANHILAAETMERGPIAEPAPLAAGVVVGEYVAEDEKINKTKPTTKKTKPKGDESNSNVVMKEEESDGSKENVQSGERNRRSKKNETTEKKKTKQKYRSHDLVRNVVFMGMGEPLNNYDNVIAACRALTDCRRWNLRHGRVTVSTVGITPKIRKLTKDLPEVALALSLHAPNQEARSAIVPAAKAYPIKELIYALDEHMMAFSNKTNKNNSSKTNRKNKNGKESGVGGYSEQERNSASKRKRAMIEYVMLEGETSTLECAHQLGKLCENRRLIVNLIPYNQTDVKDKLRCPPREHIDEFQRIIRSYGSFCYIRKTMGADIAGACGQLVVEKEQKAAAAAAAGTSSTTSQADIEDIGTKRGAMGDFTSRKTIAKTQRVFKKQNSVSQKEENTAVNGDNSIFSCEKDDWIKPLAIATGVAASCFVISISVLMVKRRR